MSGKLNERISSLEQQLKKQQSRVEQRRRTFESRQARKEDTRRKILVGALVLARVQQGRISEGEFRGWLDEALTRADDRGLGGCRGREVRDDRVPRGRPGGPAVQSKAGWLGAQICALCPIIPG
jgi:hypothetical protein